jgi:hypothetical protein
MHDQTLQFLNDRGQTLVIKLVTKQPVSKETAVAICKYALPMNFNSTMSFSSRSKPDIEVIENEQGPT